MLKCVPLDPAWTGSETRLDLKAIYRRRKQNNFGQPILDAHGKEQWDTTGPLPLRRHHIWVRKGWQYITLADFESLQEVAPFLTAQGLNWRDFIQDLRTRSPFALEKYNQGVERQASAEVERLKGLVEKHGLEAVTDLMRSQDPTWQPPVELLEVTEPVKRGPGRPKKEPEAA